jgi:hypothetical protein
VNGALLVEMGSALLIAFGFAAIGRGLLGPRSGSVYAWNDSFLVGAGICAAALFPLSFVFPRSALRITWSAIVLGAVVLTVLCLRRLLREAKTSTRTAAVKQWFAQIHALEALGFGLIALSLLGFAILNGYWNYGYDGLMIWATKAQVLYFQGGLSPEPQLWFDAGYLGRNATYPPLVPLYEALMAMPQGQFAFDMSKSVFLLFYVSLLLGTYRLGRAITSRVLALVATVMVSWLPAISTAAETFGGYADLPLACFVAAATGNLVDKTAESGWRSATPWLIGSMLMVKDEGIVLVAIACFILFFDWLSWPLRGVWKRITNNWGSIAVIVLLLLARVGYLKWLSYDDDTYRPITWMNFVRAMDLLGPVVRECAPHLVNFEQFGVFWPAFAVFGVILLIRGSSREKGLVAGAGLVIAAYTSTFLFTNWVLVVHVTQAYERILTHIAPLAAVCIVAGYHAARSERTAR